MATTKRVSSTAKEQLEQIFQPNTAQTAQQAAAAQPSNDAQDVQFTETPRTSLPEPDVETDDQALLRVLGSLGNDDEAMVLIYRQGQKYEDQTYIDECPPSEFRLSMLQEEPYNGGTFRIHVRAAGKAGFLANRKIKVQPKAQKVLPSGPDPIVTALAKMQEQQQLFMKEMAAMMQRPAGVQQSPMDLLMQLKMLKELTGPAVAPSPAMDQIAMMKQVFNMAKEMSELSGGGGEVDPIMRGLEKFALPFLSTMQAHNAQQQQVMQPAAPAAPPPPPPAAPTQTEPAEEDENMMMLRYYIGQLIAKAAGGSDPGIYADLILDNAPDELIEQYILPEDWQARLVKIEPAVAQHAAWFAKMRDLIFTAWTELDPADTTAASTGASTQQNVHSSPGDAKPDAPANS